jgi:hypothetical protein
MARDYTMKRLFSPCTRLRDRQDRDERQNDGEHEAPDFPPEILQELNLDVSTEEFLSAERAGRRRRRSHGSTL